MKKVFFAILISTVCFSCSKDFDYKDFFDKGKDKHAAGFVYTMSNDEAGNSIICYTQKATGGLTYKSTTASGGAGNGMVGLGSQGSVVIDAAHRWLYAVNAGSNSISSFAIERNGSLKIAHTVSSNGTLPVSVTTHGTWLYVVNSTTSNISGYAIGAGGTLTAVAGSNQPLSAASAGPAQISFTPDGRKLIVTEKATNKITSYAVDGAGIAGAGNAQPAAGKTPFGFDFSGNNYIVVSEASGGMPNVSSVSSYSIAGSTQAVTGALAGNQTSACWTIVSADGKYAFVANTMSNTLSSLRVSNDGKLKFINAAEVATGTTPIDLTFSGDENYVYNLNSGSHSITQYQKGGNASLKKIGELTGLPAYAVGLAAF